MIKDINVEVIEPLEKRRHGGIIYHVQTESGVVTVQLEGDLWYEPNYGISSESLLEVVTEVIRLDREMCGS